MPPRLRRRMDALRSQTDGVPWAGGPVLDAAVLTVLAQACRDDELVAFDYTARDGAVSQRRVEPHRLVSLGRRWYLVAYDRDRQDWRSFRVDRISSVAVERPAVPAARAPGRGRAVVRRGRHPVDAAAVRRTPPTRRSAAEVVEADIGRWATVTPDGDGCLVHMPTDTLDWPFMVLARTRRRVHGRRPAGAAGAGGRRGGPVLPVRAGHAGAGRSA